ncbi:MAG TPA: protein kinase [Thermoanaerobaculia bacterium]
MTLAVGARLGPYEIVSPLGAGGMGEVYKARDTRLGREIALKVLPQELSRDRDRLARFEQEARSASALNHPNIVTVHDIGQLDEVPYIAMEFVEGKTLRELSASEPLPMRKLLSIAAQIADGLAKAHAAGIIHRDLKPENLMVSKDGFVKILDFGLAKLAAPESGGMSAMPTLAKPETHPGTVMGTVAYMSPEQASGQPLDFRTDQFSLGSILFELVTGRRPFEGKTGPETLAAIIRQEPTPIGELAPATPAPLRWIIERCLAKDPEERYSSTRDLARDLSSLRDHLSEVSAAGVAATTARRRGIPAAAGWAFLAAGLTGFAAFFLGRNSVESLHPSYRRLTFSRGYIFSARFAPDGQTVVYGASWNGKPVQLFSTRPGSPESLPFSLPSADVLSISFSGELALSLGRHVIDQWEAMGTLAQVPISGSAPREVLENVLAADWAPDGVTLAVVRQVGRRMSLEFPIGNRLYETSGWLSHPRVSPAGDAVAFIDHPLRGDDAGIVALVDRAGRKRTLSEHWFSAQGVAWSASGKEIWFTASRQAAIRPLYRVSPSGHQRVIAEFAGTLHDISRDGHVLLARDSVRGRMVVSPRGETRERDFSWLDTTAVADISTDGTTVLFSEQGEGGGGTGIVYVRKTDGSPPVLLGKGYALALSPDKKWALAAPIAFSQLILLPTGTGQARRLEHGPIESYQSAMFLPDGKRILFAGSEKGRRARLYVQDLAVGAPRPVTAEGAGAGFHGIVLSPDGRFATGPAPGSGFARYPLEGGSPLLIEGLAEGEVPVQWSADGRSLYVYRIGDVPARIFRLDLSTGRRELWKELTPPDPAGTNTIQNVQITPDGRAYAYFYGQVLSDLYLVEGLE